MFSTNLNDGNGAPSAKPSSNLSFEPLDPSQRQQGQGEGKSPPDSPHTLPSVSLPKGGGAIKGIGEKFSVSPATGTGNFSIPIKTSSGRPGSSVQLSLTYNSGSGNGPFGFGWQLSSQSIVRKTDKGIPQYHDETESDVFLLSGAEDLVPVLEFKPDRAFGDRKVDYRQQGGQCYRVTQYQPRIEGGFLKILRLTDVCSGQTHWEVKSGTNTTIIFGDSDNSRVFDPLNPSHVFEWLPARSYDEKGNIILYEYKAESSEGIAVHTLYEQHRTDLARSSTRYLKRIKYENTKSRLSRSFAEENDWMFEIVLDYGEHDEICPQTKECRPWICRPDPFSSYRSGFELRNYRLCRRILVFHHFPDEPDVGRDCVVASFNLRYESIGQDESTGLAIATVVKALQQEYWQRSGAGYEKQSLPPLEFTYSKAKPAKTARDVDPESLANLPAGFNDSSYQLIDLDGQGLAGAVSTVNGALIYTANGGNGVFGAAEALPAVPVTPLKSGSEQWMDLSGAGKMDIVKLGGPSPGFYQRNWDEASGWDSFRPFVSVPNIPVNDKNLKFIDATGNGIADILVAEDHLFTLYPGQRDEGFGGPSYSTPPWDEHLGSRLLFWDGRESIYTADMTGDGLSDLVRIRNSEVCYWPNVGYGKFGSRIRMESSPQFDYADMFDQSLLRLADVDGTGTTDIIYLGGSTPVLYQNLSGNGWSRGTEIPAFPSMDTTKNVQIVDLLGRGTACLVWSSTLPGDAGRQIRYLDLMESTKPYLLVGMENNMGWETHLTYTCSSQFYVRDQRAGRGWSSHLPFPVQCVEQTQSVDRISGNIFTTRYAYHDGFFDGVEREFRGFGFVESWDTERYTNLEHLNGYSNIDQASHIPPVLTKTWYHNGEYRNGQQISRYPDTQYWAEKKSFAEPEAVQLSDTQLPSAIRTRTGFLQYTPSYQERREASRALKGTILRSEVYALDGSPLEHVPYVVRESNFSLEQRQPLAENQHAIFFAYPKETLEMVYDRKVFNVDLDQLFDPRITHTLTLETDFFGNPLTAMAINYGRRLKDPMLATTDHLRQKRTYAVLTQSNFTNGIDTTAAYLLPMPAESNVYEVINVDKFKFKHPPAVATTLMSFDMVRHISGLLASGKFDIPFENVDGPYPSESKAYRRLTKRSRTLYRRDDLRGPLSLGVVQSLALPYRDYQLTFTSRQAKSYIETGKITPDEHDKVFHEGGYVQFPEERDWWSPSTEVYFSPTREDSPEEELRQARENFFLVRRSRTAFDRDDNPCESFYDYDKYNLLLQGVMDPHGNRVTAGERNADPSRPLVRGGCDYRVLAPFLVMDPNRNCSQAVFDIMGNVVATAAKGKPEEVLGDSVEGAKAHLNEKELKDFFKAPLLHSATLIGRATTRSIYDTHSYYRTKEQVHPQPNWASELVRDIHASDLPEGAETRVFSSFSFSDGTGRQIQQKQQCEPLETTSDPKSTAKDEETACTVQDRWLTSSWVIFNNKNNPVRKYEPFFTDTHYFEDKAIRGVSPIFIYDAMSRGVATIFPDHTWTKVVFDPWRSEEWDKNDTVLIKDPGEDPDIGAFITFLPREDYLPSWYSQRCNGQLGREEQDAAEKAAASARTPSISFFDSLGRRCVGLEVLRPPRLAGCSPKDEVLRQPFFMDIQGLQYKVEDTLSRTASLLTYNIGGFLITETNMDNGERWVLKDVGGNPIYTWDARGQRHRLSYDRNRRVVALYVNQGQGESLVERSEYGEMQADCEKHNTRGRITAAFDQSGVTRTPKYDFKGNIVCSVHEIAKNIRGLIDWSGHVEREATTYEEAVFYNALNKVTKSILPDGTTTCYTYNDRGQALTVSTTLSGSQTCSQVIRDVEYDAKGQRTRIIQGNGVETRISYDRYTFRMNRMVAVRPRGHKSSDSNSKSSPDRRRQRKECLQDLHYFYDASGNITTINDDIKKAVFFRNHRVDASQCFVYDSLYRLVEATGREHIGQMHAAKDRHCPGQFAPIQDTRIDHPSDPKAVGRYVERYMYDSAGNILQLRHRNTTEGRSWTRHYEYTGKGLIDPTTVNNRLSRTHVGNVTDVYHYDGPEGLHGNMTGMPGLPSMKYDYGDRMKTSAQTAHYADGSNQERTYYCYDATGKRVRKITEHCSADENPTLVKETLYIGGAFEIFRRYRRGDEVCLEVQTLSIAESGRRLLLIDNRTKGTDNRAPGVLYRYQLGNYQGSTILEVDEEANVISHEEYTPYGVSALQGLYQQTEAPKRYRFLGKERDDSGLYHLGARYYAAWLGRFTSADPKGVADGLNLYQYSHSNPVMLSDPGGTAAGPPPMAASEGWTPEVIRGRARIFVFQQLLRPLAAKIQDWGVFGKLAAQDFGRMIQNSMENPALIELEKYYANATTGKALGSSRIDFQFPSLGETWEHKLMDIENYLDEFGKTVDPSKVKEAFTKANRGILAQLEKHIRNVKNVNPDWSTTKLGITIRGATEGSDLWNQFTNELNKMKSVLSEHQISTTVVHESHEALGLARSQLNRPVNALLKAAGGTVASAAKYLGIAGAVVTVATLPSTARAAADPSKSASERGQAALDTGSAVSGLALTAAGGAVKTGTLAAGGAAAVGITVSAAALGGAAAGAAVGSYVEEKLQQPLQEELGEAAGAGAAAGVGVLAGAAAGAAVGAIVGSAVPIVGTAAGAAIGAIAGAVGASAKSIICKYWS